MRMEIRRIVPNLSCTDPQASARFYTGLLGLEQGMDLGWVVGLSSSSNPTAQLQLFSADATAKVVPALSVEVLDVDAVHDEALRRGVRVVHPLTDEPWGVRRFFVQDPDGHVANVMMHPQQL
jgi:catechol 2,3-dioxygenase-like lactoylglutathione lyase family enzyme